MPINPFGPDFDYNNLVSRAAAPTPQVPTNQIDTSALMNFAQSMSGPGRDAQGLFDYFMRRINPDPGATTLLRIPGAAANLQTPIGQQTLARATTPGQVGYDPFAAHIASGGNSANFQYQDPNAQSFFNTIPEFLRPFISGGGVAPPGSTTGRADTGRASPPGAQQPNIFAAPTPTTPVVNPPSAPDLFNPFQQPATSGKNQGFQPNRSSDFVSDQGFLPPSGYPTLRGPGWWNNQPATTQTQSTSIDAMRDSFRKAFESPTGWNPWSWQPPTMQGADRMNPGFSQFNNQGFVPGNSGVGRPMPLPNFGFPTFAPNGFPTFSPMPQWYGNFETPPNQGNAGGMLGGRGAVTSGSTPTGDWWTNHYAGNGPFQPPTPEQMNNMRGAFGNAFNSLFSQWFPMSIGSTRPLGSRSSQSQHNPSFGGLPYLGSFARGGVLPRTGYYLGHEGEEVIPTNRDRNTGEASFTQPRTGQPFGPNTPGVQQNPNFNLPAFGQPLGSGDMGNFMNALRAMMFPGFSFQNDDTLRQGLSSFLTGNFPHEMFNQFRDTVGNTANQFGGLRDRSFESLMPFLQMMGGNLNYLNQYGLPGNQQLQGEQQFLGGVGQGLLGPLGGILQQIMTQGLPNQRLIEGIAGPQAAFGQQMQGNAAGLLGGAFGGQSLTPDQQSLMQTLMGFSQGGGLTPDFVKAQRELVLDPSKEGLLGQLNQLAGGQAQLTSPATQDMMRRLERDFNNSLVSGGFQNLQGFQGLASGLSGQGVNQGFTGAGIAGNLGQSGIGNALSAFGAVPQAAFPFFNQASNTGLGALSQGTQNFGVGSSLGLQNLSTIQDLAMQPFNLGAQGSLAGADRFSQGLNQFLSAALGFTGQNMQGQLGQSEISASLLRALLGDRSAQAQLDLLRSGQLGSLIMGGIQAAPGVIGILEKIWPDLFPKPKPGDTTPNPR